MHLKVFVKLKKALKALSSGQKNPKKNPKPPKNPKNPLGWFFLLKKRVFPTLDKLVCTNYNRYSVGNVCYPVDTCCSEQW
jgi:hypothetical protein